MLSYAEIVAILDKADAELAQLRRYFAEGDEFNAQQTTGEIGHLMWRIASEHFGELADIH